MQDKIAPGISITITSSSGATGRTATDDDGSFTVRVTSDEDLRTFPRLFFATIEGGARPRRGRRRRFGDGLRPDDRRAATSGTGKDLTEKETNVWEKTFEDDDIEGDIGVNDRIVAVIITAEDEEGNSGNSAGWTGGGDATPVQLGDRPGLQETGRRRLPAGDRQRTGTGDGRGAAVRQPGDVVFDETESMQPVHPDHLRGNPTSTGSDVTDDDGDLNNDGRRLGLRTRWL